MVGSSSTSGRERTLQVMFTIWRSDVSGERNWFPGKGMRRGVEKGEGRVQGKGLMERDGGRDWERSYPLFL